MKKHLFTLLTFCPFIGFAQELPYTITVLNQPFQQIDEGISLSNGEIWDDPNYVIPLGFNFQLIDQVTSEFITDYPACFLLPNIASTNLNGIMPFGDDIIDANPGGDVGVSPISYIVEGEPGQRVAKIEWRDAGFYDEYDQFGTTSNRLSFQVWLYEGSNVLEFRYGPNSIKNEEIAYFEGGPIAGIVKNLSVMSFEWETFWLLGGDPASPFVTPYSNMNEPPSSSILLNATIPDGLVYRFTPTFVNVAEKINEVNLQIYPTAAADFVNIGWSGTKTSALIYDISGRVIETFPINPGIQRMDISSLQAGTYILTLEVEGIVKTSRFIKQ